MVAAMENGIEYDSLTDEQFEQQFDVLPNSEDPLITFINSKPVNNKAANIYVELLRTSFGDSGFVVLAKHIQCKVILVLIMTQIHR